MDELEQADRLGQVAQSVPSEVEQRTAIRKLRPRHHLAVSAVLASATIPGAFPAIQREGLTLVDGGVANNAALSQAVALGADQGSYCPPGSPVPCNDRPPPRWRPQYKPSPCSSSNA